jgi:hypothetical protein
VNCDGLEIAQEGKKGTQLFSWHNYEPAGSFPTGSTARKVTFQTGKSQTSITSFDGTLDKIEREKGTLYFIRLGDRLWGCPEQPELRKVDSSITSSTGEMPGKGSFTRMVTTRRLSG